MGGDNARSESSIHIDTHKPSDKPDTAQQNTVTSCQGHIQTNTSLLNQQKTELEQIENKNKYSPTVLEAVDLNQKH